MRYFKQFWDVLTPKPLSSNGLFICMIDFSHIHRLWRYDLTVTRNVCIIITISHYFMTEAFASVFKCCRVPARDSAAAGDYTERLQSPAVGVNTVTVSKT